MKNIRLTVAAVLMLLFGILSLPVTAAPVTKITWYGHSAFKITTPTGKVLLVDPWITNPANKTGKADLAKLGHVDLILITHGHFDHVGDSAEIATKTGAPLVAILELSEALSQYGGYPKAQATMATAGNCGGEMTLLNGDVKIAFIPAVHSSTFESKDPITLKTEVYNAGDPCGFLISVKNGPVIYHTGDTDLFSDMALIPKMHKVDVMLCCIGDKFTMGPTRAAQAVALVKPSVVVPMHFGTFPALSGTPAEFSAALKHQHVATRLRVMHVHDTLTF